MRTNELMYAKDFCEKYGEYLKIAGVNCSKNKEFCKKMKVK